MSDYLTSLIHAVEVADSSACLVGAVRDLASARQVSAIPTLISTLSYNNPGAAVEAVTGLVQLGTPSVTPLLEQLNSPNYAARAWAIRALAGIGDPRGLSTLLIAVTDDFAVSVRRGAANGLGLMKWHWFPENCLPLAQTKVLPTLVWVAQKDEEWLVRYAAVVALQKLANVLDGINNTNPKGRSQILHQLERMATQDRSDTVRARVWMAQQQLQQQDPSIPKALPQNKHQPSPLLDEDWQRILEQLHAHQRRDLIDSDSVQASE